jgi:hypothetical protein
VVIFLFVFGFIRNACLAAVAGTEAFKGDWSAAFNVLGVGVLLAGAPSTAGLAGALARAAARRAEAGQQRPTEETS